MTSDLDILQREAEFARQRDIEIKKIAKERGISREDAAQAWDDDYQDALLNDYD
ncbi:hypothetical protein [Acinetobacter sp. ANC 5502]